MDPRHLVQLSVILEKGSITQASRHLNLTQPTLTHNMQVLEMQAGGTLFERSRYGVRSTPLGEMLAREGRAIGRTLRDAVEVSARHRGGLRSQLCMGTGPLVGAALVPGLTDVLFQRYPDVALTVQSDRPHALVEQLIDGRHDLVIAPSWLERPPPGIERTRLIRDDLGIFCGLSHPQAALPRPWRPGADVDTLEWISLGTASPFDQTVRDMLTALGIGATRTRLTVLGEAQVLLGVLAAGKHVAVLPRFPTRMLMRRFALAELTPALPSTPRDIYLWHRSDLLEESTFAAIRETVLDHAAQAQQQAGVSPAE